MSFLSYDVLTVLNLLINMSIMAIAVCRSGNLKAGRVLFRVRVQYILLAPAAFANAFAPMLFQANITKPAACFAAVVLFMLTMDGWQWREGVPRAARTDGDDKTKEESR